MTSPADFSLLKESRDGDQFYEDYQVLKSIVCPEYTNRSLRDPGNALARVLLGVADYLHLRADIEAAQFMIGRVRRPESAKNLLRLIGTDLKAPSAATVDVILTLQGSELEDDLPIPKYTLFRASGAAEPFILLEDGVVLPSGETSIAVTLTHGELHSETLGTSDGTAGQIFYASVSDILQTPEQPSSILHVDEVQWDIEESFALAGPSTRSVIFQREANGAGRYIFGDGSLGAIPAAGTSISLICIRGGGKKGNVGAGTVDTLVDTITLNGTPVAFSVTNPDAASGGADEQTVDAARVTAPHWWRAQDRAVTLGDYEALANSYAGILSSRARRTGMTVVTVYLLATGGSRPTSLLLAKALSFLEARRCATDDVLTAAASLIPIKTTVLVTARKGYSNPATIKKAVETAIQAFFAPDERVAAGEEVFGAEDSTSGYLYLYNLGAIIKAVEGVAHPDFLAFHRVPQIIYDNWTGNPVFSEIQVGNDTPYEQITVLFTSETTFTVFGSVSGNIGSGELDSEFISSRNEITFTLSTGDTAPAAGDKATFWVGPIIGNILLQPDEVAVLGTLDVQVV